MNAQPCPTCRTPVPEGAVRCPACGRVFGEANRCPHCHAIAALIRRGSTTVCAACGKPRGGTVLLGGSGEDAVVSRSTLTRGRGRVQRAIGVLAIAAGVLAAALIASTGALGVVGAAIVATVLVGLGMLSLRAGARAVRRANEQDRRAREAAVLEVAEKEGGVLTATLAAQRLGLSVDEADATLTAMVGDGTRVAVEVDEEGVVTYVFRELAQRPAARVRVEDEEAELQEEEGPGRAVSRARREPAD